MVETIVRAGLNSRALRSSPNTRRSVCQNNRNMDVVWLKRDIRSHDHAPLATALSSSNPLMIIYLYEPSQLSHPTVHGSHILFHNEALKELDTRLNQYNLSVTFLCSEAVDALQSIHQHRSIKRLLAHEETGHLASFARDEAVRKWCKRNRVQFMEFPQIGVKRGLKNRDRFSYYYNKFITHPQYNLPSPQSFSTRAVTAIPSTGILPLHNLPFLHSEHAVDRKHRQQGGESRAIEAFTSFMRTRAEGYARGVSSPNSAWSSCSRLSPYLAWGHISVRRIAQELAEAQRSLREKRKRQPTKDGWLKSLAAFHSRIRWRSHFIQKLESQPDLELRAQCLPLDRVRCEEGDWNDAHFKAWSTGMTGYPMVDACMRCLLEHGWVNFRMRAMLVSFACYNLWLDWRGISKHLARVFLDFEPGIHYSQLQMQAGVTGINTMRVYSATKQGKDHDIQGRFVRKYVAELRNVPTEYIHEPWKMSRDLQRTVGVWIGGDREATSGKWYPSPIVEEKTSSSKAKSQMQIMRQNKDTKAAAQRVFEKLGSRMGPMRGRGAKRKPDITREVAFPKRRKQQKISELLFVAREAGA